VFLDSEMARPLFDMQSGGTARAFECRLCLKDGKRTVTLSVRGMRSHQKAKHGVEVQAKMFTDEEREIGSNL
jgi:hypothetical protein